MYLIQAIVTDQYDEFGDLVTEEHWDRYRERICEVLKLWADTYYPGSVVWLSSYKTDLNNQLSADVTARGDSGGVQHIHPEEVKGAWMNHSRWETMNYGKWSDEAQVAEIATCILQTPFWDYADPILIEPEFSAEEYLRRIGLLPKIEVETHRI